MTEEESDLTGLLSLLDGTEGFDQAAPLADPSAEAVRRLELETLGLLIHGLDPVEPSAGARERLLAAVATSQPVPLPTLFRPDFAAQPVKTPDRATRHWGWSLAAGLLVGLLGFGAAGWLFYQRAEVEDQLTRVRHEREQLLATLQQRDQELSAERQARQGEAGWHNQALQLVATRGVEVCPLRPVGVAAKSQPDAFAVLYMAPAQKSWYVKASQLVPAPQGHLYRVWFETASGPVYAGDLRPAPNFDLQFEAAGFRSLAMKGVKVTLENEGPMSPPSGPAVLFGADKMTVL